MSRHLAFAFSRWFCLGLILAASAFAPGACLAAGPTIRILHGDAAPALERQASEELADLLQRLYDARVQMVAAADAEGSTRPTDRESVDTKAYAAHAALTICVGSPQTNAAMQQWAAQWPPLGGQAIRIRSVGEASSARLLIGGGSPAATYWAVHEFAHRLGVRTTLYGDLDPVEPPEFTIAGYDQTLEPAIGTRAWDILTPFAYGREGCGQAEQVALIHQLAKLKHNHVVLSLMPWQPFLPFEHAGVSSQAGLPWPGQHLPVDGDTAGRAAFAGAAFFQNPDIPFDAPYPQRTAAAQGLLRQLIASAHGYGMTTGLSIRLVEFRPEFASLAPLVPSPRDSTRQTWIPDATRLHDSGALRDLVLARLRAALDAYPDVDMIHLRLTPEIDWTSADAGSFLSKLVAQLPSRTPPASGSPRWSLEWEHAAPAVAWTHSVDLAPAVVGSATSPWSLLLSGGAEPKADRDQTAIPPPTGEALPFWLTLRVSDDQLGVFPQSGHEILAPPLAALRARPSSGYVAKAWAIGEQDVAAYLLSRHAFGDPLSPNDAIHSLVTPVCGEGVAPRVQKAMELIERASQLIFDHDRSLGQPAPDLVARHLSLHAEPPAWWLEARTCYLEAMNEMYRANTRTREGSRSLTLYLARRAEFGYEWFNCLEAIRKAGVAQAAGERDEQIAQMEAAIDAATSGLNAMAAVARSSSDRGLIAILNAHAYRPLVRELEALDATSE